MPVPEENVAHAARARRRWTFRLLVCSALLWLPLLLFDLEAGAPPSLDGMNPVLVRTMALAIAVYAGSAGVIAILSLLLVPVIRSLGTRVPERSPAAPIMILASTLVVLLSDRVSDALGRIGWSAEQGLILLLIASTLAAGLVIAMLVLLFSSRGRTHFLLWTCGVALVGWLVAFAQRSDAVGGWGLVVLVAVAASVYLLATSPGRILGVRAGLLSGLVLLSGVAGPFIGALVWGPGLESPLPARIEPTPDGVNVVVVMIDTLRADHTTLSGYSSPTTPNMSRIARDRSTYFSNASAAAASTVPSVKAFFTARLATGRLGPEGSFLLTAPSEWTLPRTFQKVGYSTAGFSASDLIDGSSFGDGFQSFWSARNFDFYKQSFLLSQLLSGGRGFEVLRHLETLRLYKLNGQQLRGPATRWIESRAGRPFFAYVHLIDPHWPYYARGFDFISPSLRRLPTRYSNVDLIQLHNGAPQNTRYRDTPELREMIGRYDEEIRWADQVVGDLVSDLRRLKHDKDTLLVIVGDHGEEFFEHNGFGHGHDVYQEIIHVPLLIRWPDHPRFEAMPARIHEPVSLMDVYPTLIDYLDLPKPPRPLVGRSLRPLLEGTRRGTWWPVVSKAPGPRAVIVSYREGPIKVRIRYERARGGLRTDVAFNLSRDPDETQPLGRSDRGVQEVVRRARKWFPEHWDASVEPDDPRVPARPPLEDHSLDQLKALGYLD